MAVGIGIGLSPVLTSVTGSGGGGGSTVTFVDAFEIVGEVDYTVSAPLVRAIPMPTNGNVARITLNNGATISTVDPTQLIIGVQEKSWNADGTVGTDVIRYVYGVGLMQGPYNDGTVTRLGGNVVDVSLSHDLYNSGKVDSEGRAHNSTAVSVSFGANFTPGSAAGFYTGTVTRTDSLEYPKPLVRHMSRPGRINDGTLDYEWGVIHLHAGNGKQLACFEAWAVSGGTDGVGGTTGTLARTSTMVESVYTPSGGPTAQMGQPALRAPCYRTTISVAGLSDTASAITPVDGVCWRAKPLWGPDWSSNELGDAWIGDANVSPNTPKCLPMFINTGGKYDRRYIWVNANRTAGASPAVQTSSADPGTAASYGFFRAGVIAGQAVNAARGHEATSMTGLVIMLRDISGSVRGANDNGAGAAGAYCAGGTSIWDTASTYQGFLEVRRAAGGGHDQTCRLRGVDATGTTIGGKQVAPKIHWVDIEFDSTGTGDTTALNIIATCGSNESTATPITTKTIHSFERCWVQDNSHTAAWGTNMKCLQGMGHIYEYMVEEWTAINGQNHSRAAGIVVSCGSFHNYENLGTTPRQNAAVAKTGLFGSWFFGGGTALDQDNTNPTLAPIRGTVVVHCRFDVERTGTGAWGASASRLRYNDWGQGLCGVFFRRSFTNSGTSGIWGGPLLFVGGDGSRNPVFSNYVWQHVASACYGQVGGARLNGPYNETGAVRLDRDIYWTNCAIQSISMKTGHFSDITTPQGSNEGAHSSATAWYWGDVVHDGNATASLRVYWQAKRNVPGGAGILTSDTTYWEPCATATPTTTYGGRSLRTGNNKSRRYVNSKNNWVGQFGATAGEQAIGQSGWKVDFVPWRTVGTYGVDSGDANYVQDTSGTSGYTFTDPGNYRPSSSGPLVNAVPAGDAVVPFDPYGTTRKNDGTGAIGWLEAV